VTRSDLRDLLREWTRAAELMTRGRPAGPAAGPSAPPTDTGEATGLPAARLTITIGYGPSLFDGRLGLSSRKPAALRPLPVLANEDLDPGRSGGNLCLQACSDDPQVAFHAVRNLARGYLFTDGIVPETGTLDGGLFFIAYMRDPAQFVRLQQSLTGDALNEYIRHVSSAVFVCPPGLRPGQDWGGVCSADPGPGGRAQSSTAIIAAARAAAPGSMGRYRAGRPISSAIALASCSGLVRA